MLFNEIFKNNKDNLNKIAIIEDDKKITYKGMFSSAYIISDVLQKYQFQKNDIVVIWMRTSIEAITSIMAINSINCVFAPISSNVKENSLQEYIEIIKPKAIITDNIEKLVDKDWDVQVFDFHITEEEVQVSHVSDSKVEVQNILIRGNEYVQYEAKLQLLGEEDSIAEILFSSGTTGHPKGIILSNENISANVKDIIEYMGINSNDHSLIIKPLNHSSTLNGEIMVSLFAGATIVTSKLLVTPRLIVNYVIKYYISILFLVPILLIKIIDFMDKEYEFDSLKVINFYGSTIPNDVVKQCLEIFKDVELIYSYGLSEASPRVTYIKSKDLVQRLGSSGKCLKHVSVAIRDKNFQLIESPGEVGEIFVNGPNVMQGYYNNPDLTNKVITPYGLKTGDLGYLDEEGFLYVKGRADDMIIKAAINIYPAEIENVISQCDLVKQVLVEGVSDPHSLGQKILVYVVCNNTEDEATNIKYLYDFCKANLEPIKIPDSIKIVEELKTTNTGKVLRHQ